MLSRFMCGLNEILENIKVLLLEGTLALARWRVAEKGNDLPKVTQ